jgi:hypothetical protein
MKDTNILESQCNSLREEREKKKERKKTHQSPTMMPSPTHIGPL